MVRKYSERFYPISSFLSSRVSDGSRGREGTHAPLPTGPKFLHFQAVLDEIGQIIGWRPSPLGNPGSVTKVDATSR